MVPQHYMNITKSTAGYLGRLWWCQSQSTASAATNDCHDPIITTLSHLSEPILDDASSGPTPAREFPEPHEESQVRDVSSTELLLVHVDTITPALSSAGV